MVKLMGRYMGRLQRKWPEAVAAVIYPFRRMVRFRRKPTQPYGALTAAAPEGLRTDPQRMGRGGPSCQLEAKVTARMQVEVIRMADVQTALLYISVSTASSGETVVPRRSGTSRSCVS